jgi:2-polyprenyl-6-hydroxyphenyl methylase / 3-demethylubiquinone-9 3-methyltransferase
MTNVAEYDKWSSLWWQPRGPFSTLRWIARARAEHVPRAAHTDSVLLDIACGGGLLHPYIADKGYRHVGVDVSTKSAEVAMRHGVDEVIIGDIGDIPLDDCFADVVVAGHCLEHVERPLDVVAECCRVLKPGGTLLIDTIADTWLAKVSVITLGENIPFTWAAPKGSHDHRLFVNPEMLARACAVNGVPVNVFGLVPRAWDLLTWALGRDGDVHMRQVKSTKILYGVLGVKQ